MISLPPLFAGASASVAGADYISLSNSPVSFPGSNSVIVPITIINDDLVEDTEQFRVQLSSSNPDVILNPIQMATVDIIDTDCEWKRKHCSTMGSTQTSYPL